jgi:hypothetical protein
MMRTQNTIIVDLVQVAQNKAIAAKIIIRTTFHILCLFCIILSYSITFYANRHVGLYLMMAQCGQNM